jgi:hypothetical protein
MILLPHHPARLILLLTQNLRHDSRTLHEGAPEIQRVNSSCDPLKTECGPNILKRNNQLLYHGVCMIRGDCNPQPLGSQMKYHNSIAAAVVIFFPS